MCPLAKNTKRPARGGTSARNAVTTDTDRRKRRQMKREREKKMLTMSAGAVVLLVLIIIIMVVARKNGVNVMVNGESVAKVRDRKFTTEYIVTTVEAQLASEHGTEVKIQEPIEAVPARVSKDEAVSPEYAISAVRNAVTYNVLAGVIYVNGTKVLAMDNLEALDGLLEEIKAEYVPAESKIVSSTFVDDVTTKADYVAMDEVLDKDTAYARLTQGVPTQKTYSVKSGDRLYTIAAQNGITVEELLNANPGMTINTPIKVGDTLNLVVTVPFLSVKTVEQMTYTEKQEKQVEYRTNENRDSSYKKVVQQGKDGQKEVTVEVIRINGFEEEQKVVSETVTVEPVTEIIEIGAR